MFIATLIAADRLSESDISTAAALLPGAAGAWVEPGSAYDFFLASPGHPESVLRAALPGVDIIVQPEAHRRKRLLVADMDSTMITVECIDELADYAGLKAEVAEITERAMQGELDFEAALDARVALLEGLDAGVIDRCREERVTLTPGATTLVRTMRSRGATCLLVSGGFTRFAEPVAEAIGFNWALANELLIEADRLTGKVRRPIVGAAAKHDALTEAMAELRLDRADTMAVGDGANDIPMIEAAGLGVAYHAKPAAAAAADARIEHNDLTALLYAQGIPRSQWVTG
ncbi:MAG: phosphoserine phosphatase SerB [Allosphingosinicella sp.]|uniref:phosphoserine phosphatase SerB n=1 Tax=Allosphingosinicella sp. TaxID=2823234 RepID=UPI00393EEBA6